LCGQSQVIRTPDLTRHGLSAAFWTHAVAGKGFFPNLIEISAMLAVIAAAWLVYERRESPVVVVIFHNHSRRT
jgi:hypothetical protein